jgi:biotin carboxyl carrier protein
VKRYRVTIDGRIYDVEIDDPHARPVTARLSGVAFSVDVEPARADDENRAEQTPLPTDVAHVPSPLTAPGTATSVDSPQAMTAPIPGVVASVAVSAGQPVERGDELLTLEAMKMLNVIRSPWEGTVATVHVAQGGRVVQGEPLVTFVPT